MVLQLNFCYCILQNENLTVLFKALHVYKCNTVEAHLSRIVGLE